VIPIRDDAPRARFPYFVLLLIASYLFLFGYEVGLDVEARHSIGMRFGLVPGLVVPIWKSILHDPSRLLDLELLQSGVLPLITSAFLHAGPLHVLGNALFLWVFGDNVESRLGYWRFPFFYLLCATAAGIVHALMDPGSMRPMVGASGAISGCLGAYLLLHPKAHVKLLLPFLLIVFVDCRAWVLIPIWFAIQLPPVQNAIGFLEVDGIAYMAHLGGFVAGMLLLPLFLLFNPNPLKKRAAS
jgi:membrane associated rhomboid family serine protease